VASLGEMSAAIAHEVNQPLSAIGMNASTCLRWLRDEQLNVAEARDAATRIARDATRAAEVIRGLRNLFSRSAEAKSLVDLNEAMREVVALTRNQLHGHGAIIRSELATDLPLVVCDRVQLQQVVVNLLLNAAEATREVHDRAREVQLKTLRRSTEHVHIEVSDTGPGIAPERWSQIFRPFQSTKQGGMGIGLSICKTIVESHGGTLGVNSVIGIGSTFEISLPLQPAH
jgi:C4-dicarboxylate-specific signal transduction histidine kinase